MAQPPGRTGGSPPCCSTPTARRPRCPQAAVRVQAGRQAWVLVTHATLLPFHACAASQATDSTAASGESQTRAAPAAHPLAEEGAQDDGAHVHAVPLHKRLQQHARRSGAGVSGKEAGRQRASAGLAEAAGAAPAPGPPVRGLAAGTRSSCAFTRSAVPPMGTAVQDWAAPCREWAGRGPARRCCPTPSASCQWQHLSRCKTRPRGPSCRRLLHGVLGLGCLVPGVLDGWLWAWRRSGHKLAARARSFWRGKTCDTLAGPKQATWALCRPPGIPPPHCKSNL